MILFIGIIDGVMLCIVLSTLMLIRYNGKNITQADVQSSNLTIFNVFYQNTSFNVTEDYQSNTMSYYIDTTAEKKT